MWPSGSVWVFSWKFHWNKHFLIKSFTFKPIILANVGNRGGAGNSIQNIPNQNNVYLNSTDLPSSYMRQMLASTQRRGNGIVVIISNEILESSLNSSNYRIQQMSPDCDGFLLGFKAWSVWFFRRMVSSQGGYTGRKKKGHSELYYF